MPDDHAISSHLKSWEDVFASRPWGRYPPEELVRFMARQFGKVADKSAVKVLEIGCGPGANLWFLAREGYAVAGIDGAPTAIHKAAERLRDDCPPLRVQPDLKVGNFGDLPWSDRTFDCVIDIEGVSTNGLSVIRSALSEVHRVLKPGGRFFAKMFGSRTTGYDKSAEFEPGTLRNPTDGPCAGQDLAHYFTDKQLHQELAAFSALTLDSVQRSDYGGAWLVEEWLVNAQK